MTKYGKLFLQIYDENKKMVRYGLETILNSLPKEYKLATSLNCLKLKIKNWKCMYAFVDHAKISSKV